MIAAEASAEAADSTKMTEAVSLEGEERTAAEEEEVLTSLEVVEEEKRATEENSTQIMEAATMSENLQN